MLFYMSLLQIRTHFARPNWKKVFSDLASTHQSSVIGNAFSDNLTTNYNDDLELQTLSYMLQLVDY